MNFKIDVDVTPEEIRRLVGLPDVQEFNKQVMDKMLERLTAGADGFDPMRFFQSSILSNADMAKRWMDSLNFFSTSNSSSDKS